MLDFTIIFHGPFRVGIGSPEEGIDALVDRTNPLPASSLKGVMRASAVNTLAVDAALVAEIFGAGGNSPSPWAWGDAEFAEQPMVRMASRIKIEDDSGTTERGFLMLGEHAWTPSASFSIEQRTKLTPEIARRHEAVLLASARAITSLGGLRRRGEGWVTITDTADWTTERRAALREAIA